MMFIFGMGIGLLLVVFFITLIESGVVSFLWGNLQRCNPFYWRSEARNAVILELQEEAKVKDERIARQTIVEHEWRETDQERQQVIGHLRGRIEEMLIKLADKDESIRKLGVFLESREHVIDSLRRHINSSVVEPKLVVPKKTKKKKS
jgi:hypothetical protein